MFKRGLEERSSKQWFQCNNDNIYLTDNNENSEYYL